MELRPALDGHYGIPQETRLLFGAIAKLQQFELSGLLQMSTRMARGGVESGKHYTLAEQVHRYSRTVISLKGNSAADWKQSVGEFLEEQLERWLLRLSAWLGIPRRTLSRFETKYFEDFIWQAVFARSLPSDERNNVLRCNHQVCQAPWRWMHLIGLEGQLLFRRPTYPRLNLSGHDIFITQTPYPGRVSKGTSLVVHYHDAIPILMPHTISDRAFHQASHFYALGANVRNQAWFACVSETTRRDLLRVYPEAEPRSITIHNMVSPHYFPSAPAPERLVGIVQRHMYGPFRPPKAKAADRTYELVRRFGNEDEKTAFYQRAFAPGCRYLLMVSTLEPRKNHVRLLEAWVGLRDRVAQDVKLVFVGHIGWDFKTILDACLPLVGQGGLFMLHDVPADELRLLYQHALVTVCPSVGEGFDFSGVEAMRCGGVVAASDIPVHAEVFGDAAAYFDPYDTASVVDCLHGLIAAEDSQSRCAALRAKGLKQSMRYLPDRIVPQWMDFLHKVAAWRKRRTSETVA
ncbi:MAG: glycosyltransferase family 4 protein [Gammaproteobacteria bacterium]|nr:glycosyltransferase family 4 protein [Gammaproteobacteria bacterium]MBU1654568.1 glycosyltransferase family 4 protein [Gammaproteobacteria bacterium]MBU1961960.1 glycosyltransferase family 4 protein [Gammaproteobacteria bacterium]